MLLYDQLKAPYHVVFVIDNFCIFWRFLDKRADKWPDVSQLAYFVGNRSNMTWMPTMGMPTACKKVHGFENKVCKFKKYSQI